MFLLFMIALDQAQRFPKCFSNYKKLDRASAASTFRGLHRHFEL